VQKKFSKHPKVLGKWSDNSLEYGDRQQKIFCANPKVPETVDDNQHNGGVQMAPAAPKKGQTTSSIPSLFIGA
jgi:hypothetical protein